LHIHRSNVIVIKATTFTWGKTNLLKSLFHHQKNNYFNQCFPWWKHHSYVLLQTKPPHPYNVFNHDLN
jgi:hypothetical protein